MARTLPLYLEPDGESHTFANTNETTAAPIRSDANSVGGCEIVGVWGKLASTGGKVTIRVYDDASKTREKYSVELDFTSVTQTSDTQDPAIPFTDTPYWTIQADASANSKAFDLIFYVRAIALF